MPLRLVLALVAIMMILASVSTAQEMSRDNRDVLVTDDATSSTWQAVRIQLPTHAADMRKLVRDGGTSAQMTATLEKLQTSLDRFERSSEVMAGKEHAAIAETIQRAEVLMDHLARDFDAGSDRAVAVTMRLLDDSLTRLEELAFAADVRENRLQDQYQSLYPAAWEAPKYSEGETRTSLSLYNARELKSLIERRRGELWDGSARRLNEEDEAAAREIGEMARALVLRQGEMPPLMRPGFRNAALRVDVISDNLVDYLRANDRLNYRRQLMIMRDALREIDTYLQIRDRTAQNAQ